MEKLIVSSSPHIHAKTSTATIMRDVLIALFPATVAGVVLFGLKALAIILVCVASAVLSEFVFNLICKKTQTVSDLSAAVTGLILALCLPTTTELWQCALGSVFAIVVVKCLFSTLQQASSCTLGIAVPHPSFSSPWMWAMKNPPSPRGKALRLAAPGGMRSCRPTPTYTTAPQTEICSA